MFVKIKKICLVMNQLLKLLILNYQLSTKHSTDIVMSTSINLARLLFYRRGGGFR